jgi:hypothetical protein
MHKLVRIPTNDYQKKKRIMTAKLKGKKTLIKFPTN